MPGHDWHSCTVHMCILAADFYNLRREDAQNSSHDIPWDWNNRSLTSKHNMFTHMLRGRKLLTRNFSNASNTFKSDRPYVFRRIAGCAHLNRWTCVYEMDVNLWTGFAFVKMVCRYELHRCNRLNGVCKCKQDMHIWTGYTTKRCEPGNVIFYL